MRQQYLYIEGRPFDEIRRAPNDLGAEIRFSYKVSGFRGAKLPLTYSLVTVGRDGTVDAVVPGFDRKLDRVISPDGCSESGGKDLFVPIPAPRQRYRVVLELFRDPRYDDRVALVETATFHG
jgi:hypothetical protein